MPLRGLFYFARLYHGYIAEHEENIFSKSLIKLPTPRFVVFYNGLEKDEDSIELKLSDAFEIDASEEACLECVATMININFGHNKELMKNCRDLYEYAYLVEEVRKGGMQGLSLSDSVDRAVDTCINNDILKDFLLRHRAEVKEMLLLEDVELQWKLVKKEARREGRAEGRAEGRIEGCTEGRTQMAELVQRLLTDRRLEDLERAAGDFEYCQQLLKTYGIE